MNLRQNGMIVFFEPRFEDSTQEDQHIICDLTPVHRQVTIKP